MFTRSSQEKATFEYLHGSKLCRRLIQILKFKEHIENNMESADNECRFNLASKSRFTNASYAVTDALINYAIILTRHIFTTGDEGYGVAKK